MAELFDVIESAVAARNAGPNAASLALGMVFSGPADGSNDVFEVAAGGRSRLVQELVGGEMRIRRSSRAMKLIILNVDRRMRCVSSGEVVSRYGRPAEFSLPRPPQPADAPIYSKYPQQWGELRVGISDGCVVSVVMEFAE